MDPWGVSLEDDELSEEIRLLTDVIVLATAAEGRLENALVDAALGLPAAAPCRHGALRPSF